MLGSSHYPSYECHAVTIPMTGTCLIMMLLNDCDALCLATDGRRALVPGSEIVTPSREVGSQSCRFHDQPDHDLDHGRGIATALIPAIPDK